jgi:hypothetical protein
MSLFGEVIYFLLESSNEDKGWSVHELEPSAQTQGR